MKILKCIFLFILLVTGLISCTKETIVEQKTDQLKTNKELHYGVWTFYQHEIESYSGTTMTGKKVEKFNYTVEWKRDGTYIQNRNGSLQTGSWDLQSPSVFVYDKGDIENERYYYVIRLDSNFYYRKGPFNKNGGLYTNYLAVEYYKK